jgi:methionine-rich copper-binding protein CopC
VTYHPTRSVARWRPLALAVVLAVAGLMAGGVTAAEAHDILIGTSPAGGSVVAVVPVHVMLTFDQPALAVGTEIIVTGPAGPVQTGAAVLVNNTVSEYLRPGSPAGRYTVVWRVTSIDGHPVSGKFSFTANSPSQAQQATPITSTTSTTPGKSGHGSALWVVAGGTLVVLLLVGFIITRKPRITPHDERGPES